MRAMRPTHREEEIVKNTINRSQNIDEVLHQTAKLLSHTLDYTAVVVNHGSHRRNFSSGTSNLLHQPEFRNLSHMERILELLEEEEMLFEIMEEYTSPEEVIIKIGSENKYKQVKDCSVIVSSFDVDDEPIGEISIIGPTRMYYSKAASLIDYVAKELSRVLSGGQL